MEMPKVGLGTWLIQDNEVIQELIPGVLNNGYTHIDTAQIYNNEYSIGEALKKSSVKRENIFITSKVWPANYKYHTRTSTQESLRRLSLNYIDLMILHATLDNETNLIAFKELLELKKEGIIKYTGVSNFFQQDIDYLYENTGFYPDFNQVHMSPTIRDVALEKYCKEKNIKLMAYSTLRPYFDPNPLFANSGFSQEEKQYIDSLSSKYNSDAGQILNAWAIQLGYYTIPKTVKVSRAISNLNSANIHLTEEEMNKISSLNRVPDGWYESQIRGWEIKPKTEQEMEMMQKRGLLYDKFFEER
jgi:diketogulonate reductase-like aldo/keto reductase